MAEIKVAELPVMVEGDFTSNDRFMVIDDGKARQLPLGVFQTWLLANVQGERGETGAAGRDGAVGKAGVDGKDGVDGLSAYQLAVSQGFVGSQTDWLASLKGATGAKGADGDLGWTPVLRTVPRAEDVVLELTDWVGGTGTKPTTLGYVGSTGIVTNIANAFNIRGEKGVKGDIGLTGLTGAAGQSAKQVTSVVINDDLTTSINFQDATSVKSSLPPKKVGWAAYRDTQHRAATPYVVPVSTQSVLPNNALDKLESLPTGVTSFYNSVTQKYILTDVNGYYTVNVKFKSVANAVSGFLNLSLSKDTSELPYSEDKVLRGDNTVQEFNFTANLYGDASLASNGLTIRLKTYGRAVSIYDIEVSIAKVI